MKRALIAIVDAAHARLYTYEQLDGNQPSLHEERDLVNAGRQAHGMFADKPSLRSPGATDDHRADHVAELDTRFAKLVIGEAARMVEEHGFGHVILVAAPKMLGELRRADTPLRRGDILIDEIAQDLAWLTQAQVHDHLAAMKLIDPRSRVPIQRGARTR